MARMLITIISISLTFTICYFRNGLATLSGVAKLLIGNNELAATPSIGAWPVDLVMSFFEQPY